MIRQFISKRFNQPSRIAIQFTRNRDNFEAVTFKKRTEKNRVETSLSMIDHSRQNVQNIVSRTRAARLIGIIIRDIKISVARPIRPAKTVKMMDGL